MTHYAFIEDRIGDAALDSGRSSDEKLLRPMHMQVFNEDFESPDPYAHRQNPKKLSLARRLSFESESKEEQ